MAIDTSYYYTPASMGSELVNAGGKSELNMDDFLSLLVAQLTNQDMYNTTDTDQFTQQLVQYTMVEGLTDIQDKLENLNEIMLSTYSAGMIGKDAVIAIPQEDGSVKSIVGTVTGVSYYSGETKILVGDSAYSLSQVMSVYEKGTVENVVNSADQQNQSEHDDGADETNTNE